MRKIVLVIVAAALLLSIGGGIVSAAQTPTSTFQETPNQEVAPTATEDQTLDQRLNFIEKGVQELLQRVPDPEKRPPEMPFAFGGPGHRQMRGAGDIIGSLKEKFGLTDDQVNQLKTLLEGNQETVKGLRDSLQNAQEELVQALKSDPTDITAVQQATEKIASLEKELLENRVQLALRIKDIVGPDIFQKMGNFLTPLN